MGKHGQPCTGTGRICLYCATVLEPQEPGAGTAGEPKPASLLRGERRSLEAWLTAAVHQATMRRLLMAADGCWLMFEPWPGRGKTRAAALIWVAALLRVGSGSVEKRRSAREARLV